MSLTKIDLVFNFIDDPFSVCLPKNNEHQGANMRELLTGPVPTILSRFEREKNSWSGKLCLLSASDKETVKQIVLGAIELRRKTSSPASSPSVFSAGQQGPSKRRRTSENQTGIEDQTGINESVEALLILGNNPASI